MTFPKHFHSPPASPALGGAARFQTLTVTSATSIAGPLTVTSDSSFAGAVSVTSIATVGAIRLSTATGLRFVSSSASTGASAGTLTNAPAAGNPVAWIPVVFGASTLYFPAWSS